MKIFIIFLFLHLSLFAAESTENRTDSSEAAKNTQTKQEEPTFITVSDVTEKAIKVTAETKRIQERIKTEKAKTKDIYETIEPYADSITLLLKDPNYQDISSQNLRELQKMQSELSVYLIQLEGWGSVLKSTVDVYDKNRKILKNDSLLWNQTYTNAVNEKAPDVILENISSVAASVDTLNEELKNNYDKALTNLQKVITLISTLKEMNTMLKKNEVLARNQVFYQDKAPFFELYANNKFSFSAYLNSIKRTIVEKYYEGIGYFKAHSDRFWIFDSVILLVIVFVAYFNYLYRKKKLFVKEESSYKKAFFFLGRPFSIFSLLFILSIIAIFPDRPDSIREILSIITLIPIIRILQTVTKKEYLKYLYLFFSLYALFLLDKNAIGYELEGRVFMLLINAALLFYLVSLIAKKVLYTIDYNFVTRMGNYILVLYSLLLLVALIANIYGSVLLSSRILDGVFETLYASVAFYTLYIILTGYVVIILRRRISTASNMLDKYSKNIENITRLLIKIWMLSWWFLIVVKMLGIEPYLITLKNDILAFSWQVSQTTISVQSIVDFIMIVLGTWILAFLIRTVLEVEVFARFTFPRGIPTAITTVLNYAIIITGVIIAFSSLGVSAQQFALIFGALGVGIGFGLRNIIANFVSGIIMVFERPVQIGDVIEVDKTMGRVQSIGSRASTLKTFDGSEVIIPNADFIAKEIINWTLSDKHRRKIVEFKVESNSDIELVLKIMNDVALSHPDVLKDPAPLATLQGFGEYYLEFKLYFWLSENLIVAPSDVSIGIYKALKEAGVKMPVQKTQLERERYRGKSQSK